ncbi:MAG TPA: hypothetical protein VGP72_07185 [Planctomycetota bacterium]|jgi:hypothetical protein
MNPALANADATSAETQVSSKHFVWFASVPLLAWAASAALSCGELSWLETLNAAGILAGLLLGACVCGWAARRELKIKNSKFKIDGDTSGNPAEPAQIRNGQEPRAKSEELLCPCSVRLWATGLSLFGLLALSPFFQRSCTGRSPLQLPLALQLSAGIPLLAMLALWMVWRVCGTAGRASIGTTTGGDTLEQLETFVRSASVRRNLAVLLFILAGVALGLSGQPLKAVLPRGTMLATTVLLAIPALLEISSRPTGARSLQFMVAAALAIGLFSGVSRYVDLHNQLHATGAALTGDKVEAAQEATNRARSLNEVLASKSAERDLETQWADYEERKGNFEGALSHWRRIGEIFGTNTNDIPAVRRILCKAGDSLLPWRRLIYEGFPALADPEIAPGIRAMGERPDSDVRAKLLSALLAWQQNEPEAERRRRLEEVRKACLDEVTAVNLLRRMDVKVPLQSLRLGPELIVGKTGSRQSSLGAIEDFGEVDTLVVLNAGRWEVGLNLRATPLREEWPIIRVEFNGQVVMRTQATNYREKEVPFTVNVNRGDMYHVKIVFENRQEELEQGHISKRGLVINGMSFRQRE